MTLHLTEILLTTFRNLFYSKFNVDPEHIVPIKEGASRRQIFRISAGDISCIGIYNENEKENIAFIEFTKAFLNHGLNVPDIYAISKDMKYYIEEDLGDVTLYDLSGTIKNSDILRLYEKALTELLRFQIEMKDNLDYDLCYETRVFDKKQLGADLAKFDNYYLKQFGIVIDEKLTETAVLTVSKEFLSEDNSFFTYRDFQPRNIMVKGEDLYFIDYQSGRKGPLLYDLVSFLYSGSINLNEQGREYLLNYYLKCLTNYVFFSRKIMKDKFYYVAVARLLQVLGSYGFTYKEKKDNNILSKIPKALKNLKSVSGKIRDDRIKKFIDQLTSQKKFLNIN
ncbi:MAG: phosphotransferase [Ignavibacteriae bacterium]|nr:phosphotransferase [Ignavibacteriota bacterium]